MDERRVGPYRLERLLGFGGMGEVHLAYDTVRDRMVALKLLSEALSKDADYQRRFRRESHVAARLREPHVIPIHDYGEVDGQLFIDMRLVDGQNVRQILGEGGAMPAERAVHIVGQVADALAAAHADGLVHRDIKPSNVLVTANDFVYVVDFGIARSVGTERSSLTLTGVTVGTLDYMAPERFARTTIDGRADVYSLACLLHECLTGTPPFAGDDLPSLMYAHLFDDPPRPTALVDTLPPAMDAVIATGMAKQMEARFATPVELADAARAALGGTPTAHRTAHPGSAADAVPAARTSTPAAASAVTPSAVTPSPDAPSPDAPSPDAPSPDAPSPDTPSPDTPSPDASGEPVTSASDLFADLGAVHVPGSPLQAEPVDPDPPGAAPSAASAGPAAAGPRSGAPQDGGAAVGSDREITVAVVTERIAAPAAQDGPTVVVGPRPVVPPAPAGPAAPTSGQEGPPRRRGPLLTVAAVVVAAAAIVTATLLISNGAAPVVNPTVANPLAGAPPAEELGKETAASIAVPTVRGSIAVGPTPGFLEVAPNGRFAYIANRDAGVVTVLDTAINQVTATIPIEAGPPQFVTFSPDGQRAYLSIYNAERTINLIGVVDTGTNTVVQTIPVGTRPFASQTTPDGRLLYVPSHDDGRLDVIDTASGSVVAEVPVARNPHWVAFAPDGSRLYTANHESNVVSVLDPTDNTVITTIPVGTSPHSTTLSPDGTRVSVVNYDSDEVSVIDTATNAVVATVPVGASPQDIAYSADGRFLYTADVEADAVSVISTETYQVTATIPVGDGPTSVVVSRDGRTGYVTLLNEGAVVMLDLTAG